VVTFFLSSGEVVVYHFMRCVARAQKNNTWLVITGVSHKSFCSASGCGSWVRAARAVAISCRSARMYVVVDPALLFPVCPA
jgi:hypothetical protein